MAAGVPVETGESVTLAVLGQRPADLTLASQAAERRNLSLSRSCCGQDIALERS